MYRRSAQAQILAMKQKYPQFTFRKYGNGLVTWTGCLQPLMQTYAVLVAWHLKMSIPYVSLLEPKLSPRNKGSFAEIPHLLFDRDNPENSGLCLFDPEGSEWTHANLIADTTIPWTCQWLVYYELWQLDGVWRGHSIGPESVAQMTEFNAEQENDKCLQTEERTLLKAAE